MIFNDGWGRFGDYRLRQAFARALTMVLCMAVVAAGVLHNAVAHADDHVRSEIALTAVGDLGSEFGEASTGQDAADPCSVGAICLFWTIMPGTSEWRPPAVEALQASSESYRGIFIPVHHRPPRPTVVV